jgi:hypothetical protein
LRKQDLHPRFSISLALENINRKNEYNEGIANVNHLLIKPRQSI